MQAIRSTFASANAGFLCIELSDLIIRWFNPALGFFPNIKMRP